MALDKTTTCGTSDDKVGIITTFGLDWDAFSQRFGYDLINRLWNRSFAIKTSIIQWSSVTLTMSDVRTLSLMCSPYYTGTGSTEHYWRMTILWITFSGCAPPREALGSSPGPRQTECRPSTCQARTVTQARAKPHLVDFSWVIEQSFSRVVSCRQLFFALCLRFAQRFSISTDKTVKTIHIGLSLSQIPVAGINS